MELQKELEKIFKELGPKLQEWMGEDEHVLGDEPIQAICAEEKLVILILRITEEDAWVRINTDQGEWEGGFMFDSKASVTFGRE